MHPAEFVLDVADQGHARDFYTAVLGAQPSLDVPGMTEFDLGGATLGLMPDAGIGRLLPGLDTRGAQRAELYLRRLDAAADLERALVRGRPPARPGPGARLGRARRLRPRSRRTRPHPRRAELRGRAGLPSRAERWSRARHTE